MAESKKKIRWSSAWADAHELVWAHRRRLILGAILMIVNQAMGLVLPASTKYLIDVVIGKGRADRSALEDRARGGKRDISTSAYLFQLVASVRCGSATRDY